MQKCPRCGSELIEINGVLQKKKGAMYYLSGQFATEAGMRHGSKMVKTLMGDKNNAKCVKCGFEWHAGKDGTASFTPGPAPVTKPEPRPEPKPEPRIAPTAPAPRFCRKCGAAAEPGDVYCIQCGNKL